MQALSVNDIREKYLSFFESKGCLRLPSFSLIPDNDPSILLINAGMTPMKKWFTGAETPPCKRVTTCQKCIRTPDIDQVGHTARHGTFFEMLGNFSFGDYFKKEMIPWAWEFCTKVLEMPEDRLYVSVFKEDDEAYDIWHKEVGLSEDRIFRLGKEDNFWEHGTGPCGPCSEIFFDRGEAYGCGKPDCTVGCSCDRYMEIWNLVFTQFDRQEDGSYLPLEHKNIDTGGGLERFAIAMQGVDNFFEVDNIRAILDKTAALAGVRYGESPKTDVALRVITDHIRSTTMMIADGILPANEGRGYVLRRLLRRAARYGRLLEIPAPFLKALAEEVIHQSGKAYPELTEHREAILDVILREEESFDRTIRQGLSLLEEDIREAKEKGEARLSGERVFTLHDTFGFPLDLTREIANEEGLDVDLEGFQAAMAEQKARGREAQLRKNDSAWDKHVLPPEVRDAGSTAFLGYETLSAESEILFLLFEDHDSYEMRGEAAAGDICTIIVKETPFYAEAGGQIGDTGRMTTAEGEARVIQTEKTADGIWLHLVEVEKGSLKAGSSVHLSVDAKRRHAIMRNHTSTHLLHKALRDVLGTHVQQAGSYVDDERLRFDFRHFAPMSTEEIRAVEREVNRAILADYPVHTDIKDIQEAKQSGAMALFSEKYGDRVRVVSVGDFSCELCGGTHLQHSSQACYFRIISESGIAAGIRRIEAVTGEAAFRYSDDEHERLQESASLLKAPAAELGTKIERLLDEKRQLEKELASEKSKQTADRAGSLAAEAVEMGAFKVLLSEIEADSPSSLREAGDRLKESLGGDSFILLAAKNKGSVLWLAMASESAVKAGVHCGNLIREAARITGGGGGGRADMAQAGGKDSSRIKEALSAVQEKLSELFS